jgi:hypothetical protein
MILHIYSHIGPKKPHSIPTVYSLGGEREAINGKLGPPNCFGIPPGKVNPITSSLIGASPPSRPRTIRGAVRGGMGTVCTAVPHAREREKGTPSASACELG